MRCLDEFVVDTQPTFNAVLPLFRRIKFVVVSGWCNFHWDFRDISEFSSSCEFEVVSHLCVLRHWCRSLGARHDHALP